MRSFIVQTTASSCGYWHWEFKVIAQSRVSKSITLSHISNRNVNEQYTSLNILSTDVLYGIIRLKFLNLLRTDQIRDG